MMNKETANTMQQGKNIKIITIVATVTIILIALAVGISIYNTPENRLHRQLDLGNKYLEEQNYEQAALAFEEAIVIDERCMEAYTGGIEAYLGTGDVDGAQDFYDRTLTMLARLDADFANVNMEAIVEIYLAVDDVYGGDSEKVVQILEDGYVKTGEDSRVKDKLIENYLQIGKKYTQDGLYDEALTIYDRLLELDNTNTETINDLCDCLNKYIDILMEAGKYDEIRALAEKYGDVAVNVDFEGILAQIAEIERIEAENRAFMQKVFDLMTAEDYEEGLCELYGSEEAIAFVVRMEEVSSVYIPRENDSLNGLGVGIYENKEDIMNYYFYYGDYVDGERKGNGVEFFAFYNYETVDAGPAGYYVFTGAWDNDAPNGKGTEILVSGMGNNNGTRSSEVSSGTLIGGLWGGQVHSILIESLSGEEFDLSFSAVNGVPEDITEEFLSENGYAEWSEEGYIYAYSAAGSNGRIYIATLEGEAVVGIAGFADKWW